MERESIALKDNCCELNMKSYNSFGETETNLSEDNLDNCNYA